MVGVTHHTEPWYGQFAFGLAWDLKLTIYNLVFSSWYLFQYCIDERNNGLVGCQDSTWQLSLFKRNINYMQNQNYGYVFTRIRFLVLNQGARKLPINRAHGYTQKRTYFVKSCFFQFFLCNCQFLFQVCKLLCLWEIKKNNKLASINYEPIFHLLNSSNISGRRIR